MSCEDSSYCPSLGEETDALLGSRAVKSQGGFLMSSSISKSGRFDSRNFDVIKDSMLQSDELPLSEVIDCDQWQEIFDAHEIDFGNDEDSVYTPAIALWALISQTFFKEDMRSCKAAVGRVASLWAMLGKTVCSTNTGAYCRVRSKITWHRPFATSVASSLNPLKRSSIIRTSIQTWSNTTSLPMRNRLLQAVASFSLMALPSLQQIPQKTRKCFHKTRRKKRDLGFL